MFRLPTSCSATHHPLPPRALDRLAHTHPKLNFDPSVNSTSPVKMLGTMLLDKEISTIIPRFLRLRDVINASRINKEAHRLYAKLINKHVCYEPAATRLLIAYSPLRHLFPQPQGTTDIFFSFVYDRPVPRQVAINRFTTVYHLQIQLHVEYSPHDDEPLLEGESYSPLKITIHTPEPYPDTRCSDYVFINLENFRCLQDFYELIHEEMDLTNSVDNPQYYDFHRDHFMELKVGDHRWL